MRPSTLGWCVLVVGLALATPARAHIDVAHAPADVPARPIVEAAATAPDGTDVRTALIAALAIAAFAIGRSRRAVSVTCLAVLVLVAFEAGVHSVHHLAEQRDAECAVATVSAQAGGLTIEREGVPLPEARGVLVAVPEVVSDAARAAAPDRGRAPPTA